MFQFTGYASTAYLFSWRFYNMTCRGFPHSEIPGSKLISSSPRLIAADYVLHRSDTPRYPPYALKFLTMIILISWTYTKVLVSDLFANFQGTTPFCAQISRTFFTGECQFTTIINGVSTHFSETSANFLKTMPLPTYDHANQLFYQEDQLSFQPCSN